MKDETQRFDDWNAERQQQIEADIVIAEDGDTWTVISLTGYYMQDPRPEVLQSGLTTLESAEICRECFVFNALNDELHSHPYHPGSAIPLEHFNTRGCIMAQLKAFQVQGEVSKIAYRIADALEGACPGSSDPDSEIPF